MTEFSDSNSQALQLNSYPLVTKEPKHEDTRHCGVPTAARCAGDRHIASVPMVQIYQCDEQDLSKLCLRELTVGEKNGRVGHPSPFAAL
jgi:hypothetical protein